LTNPDIRAKCPFLGCVSHFNYSYVYVILLGSSI